MRVVHCRKAPYDVYIGRANKDLPKSKWANPWVIGRDGTREEVIDAYEQWVRQKPELLAALPELKEKVMGCWCKTDENPDTPCHGDVLLKLLKEMGIEQEILPKDGKREILPLWSSHYSIGESLLTLEEVGKTKPGNPVSICDIVKTDGLKQVVLVDTRIDGFIEGQKNITKAGAQFIFGLKLKVCADMTVKDDASLLTESNVIIFCRNEQGYSDLIKIHNRAATDGFYYQARADWKLLKDFWTDNLSLGLPFFSSFIAKNLLTMAQIVPDLPVRPWVFKEVDSGLPFAGLIDAAIDKFAVDNPCHIQETKSIYYMDSAAFEAYVTFRAINEHNGSFDSPRVDHLCSDKFSYAEYKRLTGGVV